MTRLGKLTVDEAAWLILMSEGRRKKSLSRLAMSDSVLDALLDRGLIVIKNGIVEITENGITEVHRIDELTAEGSTLPALRARANALGSRITPIPRSRTPR